jgi:hypothetical protein
MDAADRERVRRLVDAATRASLRRERFGFCRGCGVPYAERTKGCHPCSRRAEIPFELPSHRALTFGDTALEVDGELRVWPRHLLITLYP